MNLHSLWYGCLSLAAFALLIYEFIADDPLTARQVSILAALGVQLGALALMIHFRDRI